MRTQFAALAATLCCGMTLHAQDNLPAAAPPAASGTQTNVARMSEVVVKERADSLLGIAESASQGTVGADQLEHRTLSRPGEVLETVPGVIITQHSGAGKANQYFLRGFNLDHGTDFSTSLDGMPINLPTHGHGQGYTDLNLLIPELVSAINYRKGPYYADVGDFSSTGTANIEYFRALPQSELTLEGGSFNYGRAVFISSPKVGDGHLLYGVEAYHNDGPYDHPDDFHRFNGVVRYSQGNDANGWSVTAMGYHGDWDASDQLAQRAVDLDVVDRFGSLDTTTGGDSQRYSLSGEWHRADTHSATKITAYGFYYDLDLFSNFTYYDAFPVGDQFEQMDKRWVGGVRGQHTWFGQFFNREMENSVGLDVRHDAIHNGLFNTVGRERVDKLDYDGVLHSATVREDHIGQTSVSPWLQNKMQWAEKFRTVAGLRADVYHFDVDSDRRENSGNVTDGIVSPKGALIFGPWADTELYLEGGLGFHSNDARGATTRVDPVTGLSADADGNPIEPVDPLVRTCGAEVGVRTTFIPHLHSTLSLWWLDIDSELLFVGDAGTTEASRPSRRYGVEWANYYTPLKWLTLDADFSFSHARFRDSDPAGDYIPGSIESVIAAGITLHHLGERGFFGGIRLRYFGERPLIEDNSVRSDITALVSLRVGYDFSKNWSLSAEVYNLLNRKDSEIDYYYGSRLRGETATVDDVHSHPADPISFRVALTARF